MIILRSYNTALSPFWVSDAFGGGFISFSLSPP
jgi:hypothetical protein